MIYLVIYFRNALLTIFLSSILYSLLCGTFFDARQYRQEPQTEVKRWDSVNLLPRSLHNTSSSHHRMKCSENKTLSNILISCWTLLPFLSKERLVNFSFPLLLLICLSVGSFVVKINVYVLSGSDKSARVSLYRCRTCDLLKHCELLVSP